MRTITTVKMKVKKTTFYKNMASGRNFCTLVEVRGKKCTGFGKTEVAAIEDAKKHFI